MLKWGQVAHRRLSAAVSVVLALELAACATRPGADVLAPAVTMPGGKTAPIYVATTRQRANPSENVFTAERASTLNFARFIVSVPPNHQPGRIEWPDGKTDAALNFATIEQSVLTDSEFRRALAQPAGRGKKQNLLIFVHGFNNNFQESLYRLAQINADSGFNGRPILFAWPSQANPMQYEDDKAMAIVSRSQLIELLAMVTSSPQAGEIMVVAHSMGGMLVADALRELRVQRRDRIIARLNRVVLAAPDVDAREFRSQVQTIGPLKPPLTVLVAKDDAALRLSNLLSGSQMRAGALDVDNPLVQEAALEAKVQVVDISALQSTDGGMNHDRLLRLLRIIRGCRTSLPGNG